MITIVGYIKRRPGMGVEDFQQHWRSVYGPLITKLPGLRRYVQSHTLLAGYRKGEPIYDGVAELWFDSEAAFNSAAQSPEMAAAQADRQNFLDFSSFGTTYTNEHVIKDGPVPRDGVKNIEFVTRKPGMPVADFQKHWREVHGPLGAAIPVVKRYIQSQTRPEDYRDGQTPQWDGFALTWFDSTDAMRQSALTEEYARTREDEPNFIAPGHLPIVIAKEYVLFG